MQVQKKIQATTQNFEGIFWFFKEFLRFLKISLGHSALDAESITKPSMDSCFRRNDSSSHSVLDAESQKQNKIAGQARNDQDTSAGDSVGTNPSVCPVFEEKKRDCGSSTE